MHMREGRVLGPRNGIKAGLLAGRWHLRLSIGVLDEPVSPSGFVRVIKVFFRMQPPVIMKRAEHHWIGHVAGEGGSPLHSNIRMEG